jgi:hypothetical protein
MAVHYPAQFRNATALQPPMSALERFAHKMTLSPTPWNYPYGSNSVVLLDAAFGSMFDQVIQLDHRPEGLSQTQGVLGTLVAEYVIIDLGFQGPRGRPVKATYKVSLYDVSGALATSWQSSSDQKLASPDRLGATIHAAMTEAVARLVSAILDEKHKFKEWLAPATSR